jgi:hypothetical protein
MENSQTTSDAPEIPVSKKISAQLWHSTLGEIASHAVSIGAVYATHHLLPNQTQAATQKLAKAFGKMRSTSTQEQLNLAKEVMDFTLANIAGTSNMGVQFIMHRRSMKPEDKPPLPHELGRVILGRIAGTITCGGTLALAKTHAPKAMLGTEHQISKLLGNTKATDRFSELLLSNIVQSAGALAGNVPSQLLYDKLVGNQHKKSIAEPLIPSR